MTAATPRPPDLTRAREHVRAVMATTDRHPAAQAVFPLTFLAPALEARLAQRFAAGLTDPRDFPRRAVLLRTVLPSATLAVLDAIALVVALVAGNTVLAVVAGILLLIFVLVAAGGWRLVGDDPLRLTAGERRAIDDARTWTSSQDWSGEPPGPCGVVGGGRRRGHPDLPHALLAGRAAARRSGPTRSRPGAGRHRRRSPGARRPPRRTRWSTGWRR